MSTLQPGITESALSEYLAECGELIQSVSASLEALKTGKSSQDRIDSIYRDIHTFKGSAQLFGFQRIGEVAHAMETSLDPVRRGRIALTGVLVEALYGCLDAVEKMVEAVRTRENSDFSDVVSGAIARLVEASIRAVDGSVQLTKERLPALDARVEPLPAPLKSPSPQAAEPSSPVERGKSPDASETPRQAARSEEAPPGSASPSAGPPPAAGEGGDSSTSIRVPVALLDKLMTLMGEMVLVRNQVLQYANRSEDLEFMNLSQRLDVVTGEIQGEVMKTRMQPIGNVLSKFQRVVRDLSRDLGKRIDLVLEGTETELDKTLLEAVKDPVMHIVRNSCDHGIETPEERRAARKPEAGTISIRSYHEGGQVVVEVTDDGRGLDRARLVKKALEKGLLSQERAANLSEREAFGLIFAPGFSTAAQVTNVSGRGVGMDVVKSNIERIGGIVELSSELGKGTCTRLKIPLTLAIVPAMIARVGADQFAIPQVKLVELVRVEKGTGGQQVEFLQGQPVYRLRGNLMPLVSLARVLSLGDGAVGPVGEIGEITNIVVVAAEGLTFGLIVDEVLDTADIVVKPLHPFLKSLSVYSGATVLGNGSVALILDVMGIATRQGLIRDGNSRASESARSGPAAAPLSEQSQEFLLFRLGSRAKYALPLSLVHRLEEFPAGAIELSGGHPVMRYRGSVLPLVSLEERLGEPSQEAGVTGTIPVVVIRKSGRLYGIRVTEILDTFTTTQSLDDSLANNDGVLGSFVTTEEVLVVVDVLRALEDFVASLGGERTSAPAPLRGDRRPKRVLFVEDTVFFKKHVGRVLERAGFEVTHAGDGVEGLAALEAGGPGAFDVILADIEMPRMNGLEMAAAIRRLEGWRNTPMVALTTRTEGRFIEEGKRAGFDAYLEKLNPETLLRELSALLERGTQERSAA